uniref:Uncharacterized protein n=1 Tax=Anguilla anguilla TaxID=7936 RepID=A0A0E9V4E2_ANGAN
MQISTLGLYTFQLNRCINADLGNPLNVFFK